MPVSEVEAANLPLQIFSLPLFSQKAVCLSILRVYKV
jgi:hypothetical protein